MSKDFPISFTGNIGGDVDIKYLDGGKAVANFSVAGRESKKEGDQWVDADSSWLDCKAFGKLAENITETCSKGTRVTGTGFIKQERWEKDGEKRSKLVVMVETIGPDLRWAEAKVTRNEKGSGSSSSSSSKPAPVNPYQ